MFYFVKRLITTALDRSNREREMASTALSSLYADVSASTPNTGAVLVGPIMWWLCVCVRMCVCVLVCVYLCGGG